MSGKEQASKTAEGVPLAAVALGLVAGGAAGGLAALWVSPTAAAASGLCVALAVAAPLAYVQVRRQRQARLQRLAEKARIRTEIRHEGLAAEGLRFSTPSTSVEKPPLDFDSVLGGREPVRAGAASHDTPRIDLGGPGTPLPPLEFTPSGFSLSGGPPTASAPMPSASPAAHPRPSQQPRRSSDELAAELAALRLPASGQGDLQAAGRPAPKAPEAAAPPAFRLDTVEMRDPGENRALIDDLAELSSPPEDLPAEPRRPRARSLLEEEPELMAILQGGGAAPPAAPAEQMISLGIRGAFEIWEKRRGEEILHFELHEHGRCIVTGTQEQIRAALKKRLG